MNVLQILDVRIFGGYLELIITRLRIWILNIIRLEEFILKVNQIRVDQIRISYDPAHTVLVPQRLPPWVDIL